MNVWVNYNVNKNNPEGSASLVGVASTKALSEFWATRFRSFLQQQHVTVEFDEKPHGFSYVAKGLKSTGEDLEMQGFYGWREQTVDQ